MSHTSQRDEVFNLIKQAAEANPMAAAVGVLEIARELADMPGWTLESAMRAIDGLIRFRA